MQVRVVPKREKPVPPPAEGEKPGMNYIIQELNREHEEDERQLRMLKQRKEESVAQPTLRESNALESARQSARIKPAPQRSCRSCFR